MKFIKKDTDYAIRALNYIADKKGDIVSVSEITRELKIPHAFLRKILQILQKKSLLRSFEGKNGGFTLACSNDRIFLVDLIRIFQGPVKLTDCLFRRKICPDVRYCLLKKKIERIEHFAETELKAVSLASLYSHRNHK